MNVYKATKRIKEKISAEKKKEASFRKGRYK
jgi:hypothetical protein